MVLSFQSLKQYNNDGMQKIKHLDEAWNTKCNCERIVAETVEENLKLKSEVEELKGVILRLKIEKIGWHIFTWQKLDLGIERTFYCLN